MSKLGDFLKNLIYIPDEEDDDTDVVSQQENEPEVPKLEHKSAKHTYNSSQQLSNSRKKHKPTYSNNESLQIDCINIPKDEADAVNLAKTTIDKLQGGHPVIASASEIIRDGKYYHMLFGACYALDCKIEKITPYSFLFLPRSFNVNNINKKELASYLPKSSFLDDANF
ncbi:MAG: cell division protein SepF [Caldisericia bacterium]|nr:cell division protein SepF [Caldisericia bacterium]